MKDFEINIKPNGISIKTKKQKTLYDADGTPVVIDEGNHRQAVGVGNFETLEEYKSYVDDLLTTTFEPGLAKIVAEQDIIHQTLIAERDEAQAQRDAAIAERDALKAKPEAASNDAGGNI